MDQQIRYDHFRCRESTTGLLIDVKMEVTLYEGKIGVLPVTKKCYTLEGQDCVPIRFDYKLVGFACITGTLDDGKLLLLTVVQNL